MKRRLNALVLAVTSLVVISFTVPLAALVQRDADAAARNQAEATAQTVAVNIVRVAVTDGVENLSGNVPALPDGIGLVFPDGVTAGLVTEGSLSLSASAATQQRAVSAYTADGWELAVPVLTREGAVVVTATVPREALREGVIAAWTFLGLLGVGVIIVSMALASRLGRSLTRSVATLGEAARSLAAGDFTTRVQVDDPPELASVATAFNDMAPRLEALIAQEREEVADLSHRLRTPLARLRLQVEGVSDGTVRLALTGSIERLERAVDEVIAEARRRPERLPSGVTDLAEFLVERAAFWSVLAEEQDRAFEVSVRIPPDSAVAAGERELTAALDAVLGNVFDHTDEGVSFWLRARLEDALVVVGIEDDGSGFSAGLDPLVRGVSGASSTGLGLDIARRTAERAGGTLRVGSSQVGGASVEFVLPLIRNGQT